jgi:hypothetical protein
VVHKCKEATKVEITPEMIKAGVAALYGTDKRFDSDEEIAAKIFRAMAAKVSRPTNL